MLACARIGAIHSVVFGGFSPDSLANRIQDCDIDAADHRRRGPARRPHGAAEGERRRGAEDSARASSTSSWCTRDRRRGADAGRARPRLRDAGGGAVARLPAGADGGRGPAVHPVHLGQHRQAEGRAAHHRRLHGVGQLSRTSWCSTTSPGEIYWCTADVGWVTGHTYIVYGPLANGATTLMFEGIPNYPDSAASGRWWTSTRSTSSTPRRPRSAR